jgi:phosphogluconate 2-dehydrogenase
VKKNVVVFSRVSSAAVLDELGERYNLNQFLDPLGTEREAFFEALAEADGLLGASLRLDAGILDKAPRLQVIASVSAGYDNYDLAYLKSRGIRLTNTPDAVTEATADTGFMLLMMAARRGAEMAEYVKAGHWRGGIGESLFGVDVHGKRLGIVGLGRIGAAVARRGHFGFGMPVLYCGNSAKPEYEREFGARRLGLHELLREADFVCVCVPLSAQTHHLIGSAEFAAMRPETILVNIARGPVVDEPAMIEALQRGQFRGAGLDVFEQEPLDPASPLLQMANVVALPHIGSATVETRALMARTAAQNLIAVLGGELPLNPVC